MSSTGTPHRRSVVIPAVLAVIAALVTLVTITATNDSNSPEPHAGGTTASHNNKEQQATDQLARRTPGDPLALGKADAPVVMIDFSDFQCPFCGQFARTTEHKLYDKYVKTGILRIEWRDFPYFGEESNRAALVARAAAEQDGFWKFHDAIYAHQSPPNSGTLTLDHLIKVAESAGLKGSKLRADIKAHGARYKAEIKKDFQAGQSIGVSGTPAFIINGRPVLGAQPLSEFQKVIDQAASDADGE